MKSKILKYFLLASLAGLVITSVLYFSLSNRYKAIIKTKISHRLGLVDNTWSLTKMNNSILLKTPTLIIDNIYKSMEGPDVSYSFQINPQKNDLVYINSFSTKAVSDNENKALPNDFICHTNIDFYDGPHYSRWQLDHRIGEQYPRLTSMSNGIESYKLPEGFGFPIFTNENLFLYTQALNHNLKDASLNIKHEIEIGYTKHHDNIKPLTSKTIFIMLPYDAENPFKGPTEANPNMCLPLETKNHSYSKDGEYLSGHWVIFPEEKTYSYDVTHQLALKDSTTMHHIATHLHPFAEQLDFKDKTTDSILFSAKAENYKSKIGLQKIAVFSDKKGVMLHPDHEYELILKTNNTSGINQDMMASMFIFLYDSEMHEKIKKYTVKND